MYAATSSAVMYSPLSITVVLFVLFSVVSVLFESDNVPVPNNPPRSAIIIIIIADMF